MNGNNGFRSFGGQIRAMGAHSPDDTALVFIPEDGPSSSMTWLELDERSTQAARLLSSRGLGASSNVVVGLKNSPQHVLATIGSWKIGACVVPVDPRLPKPERDALLALALPELVISDWSDVELPNLGSHAIDDAVSQSTEPLPDRVPEPGMAIASGGSTGRSKLIVNPRPLVLNMSLYPFTLFTRAGCTAGQVQLVCCPFYHTLGFLWGMFGLMLPQKLIIMERFDAGRALQAIQEHQVNFVGLVPTMMKRIVAEAAQQSADLSSLETVYHAAAACPAGLKRAFMDLVGPERVYEAFGATEYFGSAEIRGDEWLVHPGSVGRPAASDLKILDDTGNEVPVGSVGEIFMRPHEPGPTYAYIGAEPVKMTEDGFGSVGDLGYVDELGYLYSSDRRSDMIISGGANIYPAEVESALTQHPDLLDVAVVGLPDDEWGSRVHAIVVPVDFDLPPAESELEGFAKKHIAASKVPKSWEIVRSLPRNEAGKLRRSALAQEREGRA